MLYVPGANWIGWSSAKPRSFKFAILVALAFCALGKSFSGLPLLRSCTEPVGHANETTPVVAFSQGVPLLLVTSTRRIYGDPYATFCAAVVMAPLAVTKLTITFAVCFGTLMAIGVESLAAKFPSPP